MFIWFFYDSFFKSFIKSLRTYSLKKRKIHFLFILRSWSVFVPPENLSSVFELLEKPSKKMLYLKVPILQQQEFVLWARYKFQKKGIYLGKIYNTVISFTHEKCNTKKKWQFHDIVLIDRFSIIQLLH